ncbi:hypothetical protein [Streptomyces sp. NRRL S-378]|uniref:hypothetical protein n=1 Tax=Streptomyces sp. NRRL S-378 TaxID=1463904 RepID=UPI00131AD5DE|nr:hypothetical protein [Streptomyces sp. NRRL S-378]
MAELVAAGAPELPDGWFYRIKDTHLVGLRVDIRRRRRVGSTAVRGAYSYVFHSQHDDAQSAVVAACTRAHEKWQAEADDIARFRAVTAYIGDHDPRGGAR